mgnify:CR=1 FL=1
MEGASPLHAEASSAEYARLAPKVCAMIEAWMREGEQPGAPVMPHGTERAYREHLRLALPDDGVSDDALLAVMRELLEYSVNPWTDRFLAKLYSAPTVASMCGEMLLSAMNASVHVFSASPALTLVEEECVRALCALYGFGAHADGITMPGGAASNTLAVQTALCGAFGGAYRRGGIFALVHTLTEQHGRVGPGARPALLTSAESHFSIDRAALASGLGMDAVVHIESDEHGRMRVDALERMLAEMCGDPAHPRGMPFFVNATSGTTVLGAFDPLPEIAALCEKYGCWLHVDASWGGAAVFSPTLRDTLLRGVERAQSLTVNPHKLLNVTHQCSFLLVQEARVLSEHAIHAGYLFHDYQGIEHAQVADRAMKTLGCGRRGEALKLYLTWRQVGTRALGAHLDAGVRVAHEVLAAIRANDALELGPLAAPLFLQICFRPRRMPGGVEGSDATRALEARLQAARQYAVDFAPTRSGDYVRLVVHPRVPAAHYFALLDHVTALTRE